MKKLIIALLFFTFYGATAQIINQGGGQLRSIENRFVDDQDTVKIDNNEIQVKLSGETKYEDYKIIGHTYDTTFVDTSLNINEQYLYNYRRKDNLELMPFANQGQPYNALAYDESNASLFPKIGFRTKHYGFKDVEDINYYYVPTPVTELMYKRGIEQGQVLDAFFTFNTSRQFNASVSFKGLRSLGNYRNSLSDLGHLDITTSYHTKNQKYYIRAHLSAQDIYNDENGGLTPESIENFETGDPNFKDRKRLVTNFTDATNGLRGNRYFIDHHYYLWKKSDSTKSIPSQLKIGHVLNYERKNYSYTQDAAHSMFGPSFNTSINDKAKHTKIYNQAYVALNSPIVGGELKFKAENFDYDYSYNSVVIKPNDVIPNNLSGNVFSIGGEWQTQFKQFNISADASTIVSGPLYGHQIKGTASFKKDSIFAVDATVYNTNTTPNFNFLLQQSSYKAFNWHNDFKNEVRSGIDFNMFTKWFSGSVAWSNIDNYAYFGVNPTDGQAIAMQANESINYLKVRLNKEFKFGKFALDNQIIYQNVSKGSNIYRVPEFLTRNTFYYSNYVFKGKPMFLQTGITMTYFNKYFMNAYNPVISEFYLQNDQQYGGFPMFDFFVNAKVRTMRIFLSLQHFNAGWIDYNYYSAPTYPYRDLSFRFGLIWNFFI